MPSLSDAIAKWKNPVQMLRNSQIGMYVYPVVAAEFQNWRNEQAAWRESAVLFDQSHHMDELIVEGPQATEFLAHHGINAFSNFDLNRAKHYVPVTPAGHVIGDHIIFRERADKYILVGRAPTPTGSSLPRPGESGTCASATTRARPAGPRASGCCASITASRSRGRTRPGCSRR